MNEFLDDLPREKCPRCGLKTLVIHGEGILSSGEHYSLADCESCDYPDEEEKS